MLMVSLDMPTGNYHVYYLLVKLGSLGDGETNNIVFLLTRMRGFIYIKKMRDGEPKNLPSIAGI